MSMRALATAALVVAGAIVALVLALGEGDKPPSARDVGETAPAEAPAAAERAAGAETASATPAPPVRARPPALPGGDKPPSLGTTGVGDEPLWTVYDNESRDPAWATPQEEAIRARLRPLLDAANHDQPGAVKVPQVECREVHCRMLVTGADQQAFMQLVESLQDERGFYGDAKLLALDGYGKQVDKKTGKEVHEVRVHLKYER